MSQIVASGAERRLVAALDAMLQQVHRTFDLPGMAVGVVQGDQILYARPFGVADITKQAPVTTRSLFHQASISKVFVATAVLQLVEVGKVRLDDPFVQHMPHFRPAGVRAQRITIENVLSHTSGLPDPEDHGWDRPEYDEDALDRYVRSIGAIHVAAQPGQEFAYSSLGYDLLGALVAQVSGEAFEAYVQHHILEPLGMHDSTFCRPDVLPELATSPHIRLPHLAVSDIFPYSRPHAPSGALESSVLDMCQWAMAHLNGGELHGNRILSPESQARLWQPRAPTGKDTDPRQVRVGLGWFLGEYRGTPVAMHDGADIGYEAELVLVPERSVGVVVMTNVFPGGVDAISQAVLGTVLGLGAEAPRPPLLVPLLAAWRDAGLDAAVALCRRLGWDAYDCRESFWRDAAFILGEARRPAEAIDVLRLARCVYPGSWWIPRDLARLYAEAGDRAQAVENAHRALGLKPDDAGARASLSELAGIAGAAEGE